MIKEVAGAAVAIFVISALLVPAISDFSVPQKDVWYYDDYREISAVDTVGGSLETVTVGGTEYVHAKDVGRGSIKLTNGTVRTVDVQKARLDVVFMYGQSNAAYRFPDPPKADPVPALGTAYYWGGDTVDKEGNPVSAVYAGLKEHVQLDPAECRIYSIYDDDGVLRVGDKMPSFCATYTGITGHKVLWVDGAVGGEKIANFYPGSGEIWIYGKAMLDGAIAAIDTDRFDWSTSFYMWIQGESDSTTAPAVYKTGFLRMHNAILSGEMGYSFDRVFISTVAYGNTIEAQKQMAAANDTIVIATTVSDTFTRANGLLGSDNLHYTQLGDNIIGTALGEAAGEYSEDRDGGPGGIKTMFRAIPIFAIIAVFLGMVGIFYRRD